MIQPARFPVPETTVAMDPKDPHPNEDPTPAHGEGSTPIGVASTTKPNTSRRRIEHPMQAIMGAVVVLLLGFALTQTNDRISETNDRISRLEDRVSRLEDRVDAGFAKVDERFAQQDAKLDEINLKLTALIAAINATAEVEAALDGRLLDPNTTPTDEPAN